MDQTACEIDSMTMPNWNVPLESALNSELAVDSPSQSCSGEGRSAKEQVGAEWLGNGLGWLNSNASQRSTKTGLREKGNWTVPLF